MSIRILFVEDDTKIVELVSTALKIRWSDVEIISTCFGEDALDYLGKRPFDIVILDLGLPDIDGLDVLKRIRDFSIIPVIILTVRADESDIVKGLELGADEYITKPFHNLELIARVNSLNRRCKSEFIEQPISAGPLHLDINTRILVYKEQKISLTSTESRILYLLMLNPNHVVTLQRISDTIWGDNDVSANTNAIRVYTRRIREKLENNPDSRQLIITKPGIGYSLCLD